MKKVVYIGTNNLRGEAEVYEFNDFIDVYNVVPGLPIKTNGTGLIDASLLPTVPASLLQVKRLAAEAISIGDVVKAVSNTHIGVATQDGTIQDATAFGVAVTAGGTGAEITVVLLGVITNAMFSIFPVNSVLFLDVDGAVTDDRPLSGFLTPIAKSLGSGDILIQPGLPTVLV